MRFIAESGRTFTVSGREVVIDYSPRQPLTVLTFDSERHARHYAASHGRPASKVHRDRKGDR